LYRMVFPVFRLEIQGEIRFRTDARETWRQFYHDLRRRVRDFSLSFSPNGIYAFNPDGEPIGHLTLVAYGMNNLAVIDGQIVSLETFRREFPETHRHLYSEVAMPRILDVNERFRNR